MSRRYKDTKPIHPGPLALAASQCGGILIGVKLQAKLGLNGGCGAPTNVDGTNGGTMPCGSFLHRFGKKEPYYCAACSQNEPIQCGDCGKYYDSTTTAYQGVCPVCYENNKSKYDAIVQQRAGQPCSS